MIYKGPLNKRDGELQVYLFDHALLFTKLVKTKQHEHYKVYRRPIPLELLYVHASEDAQQNNKTSTRHRQNLTKKNSFTRDTRAIPSVAAMSIKPDTKGFWMNFVHLGRKYYNLVLWANSQAHQKKWLESIHKHQAAMRERSMFFDTVAISENFFTGVNKVNCAAPYSKFDLPFCNNFRLTNTFSRWGAKDCVWDRRWSVRFGFARSQSGSCEGPSVIRSPASGRPRGLPASHSPLWSVQLFFFIPGHPRLTGFVERQVITFPLDALNPMDPMAGLKRAKRISSHTSFFKAGICLGRMLVCIVKSSQLSSTFKTLEPIDQNIRGRSKPTFRKLLQGGHDTLQLFRVRRSSAKISSQSNALFFTTGVLHSRRVYVNPLFEDQDVCRLLSWLRDRRLGIARYTRPT